MRIISTKDYPSMSRVAANLISTQVILKPDSVLGLATGSSPIGTYEFLIDWYKKGDLDFSQISTVNLDEYVGLDTNHDQSYAYFMHKHLLDHINIDQKNTHLPDGINDDTAAECARYDKLIHDFGGIDLQLLGIGGNGHVGFNEPDSFFPSGTHKVALTQSTLEANKRFFPSIDDVPTHAYTMGIRDIMQAKRVVMVINGVGKAQTLKDAFFGPVTPQVPASILQFHSDFTLVADEAALSLV